MRKIFKISVKIQNRKQFNFVINLFNGMIENDILKLIFRLFFKLE